MVFRSLYEQVQNPSPVLHNPVNRPRSVHKTQDFDFFRNVMSFRPIRYISNRQRLSMRDSG